MATHFELWNDRTNNLIDEFDTIEQALNEVRWRINERGDDAGRALSLVRLDTAGTVEPVSSGDGLVRRARDDHYRRLITLQEVAHADAR